MRFGRGRSQATSVPEMSELSILSARCETLLIVACVCSTCSSLTELRAYIENKYVRGIWLSDKDREIYLGLAL